MSGALSLTLLYTVIARVKPEAGNDRKSKVIYETDY